MMQRLDIVLRDAPAQYRNAMHIFDVSDLGLVPNEIKEFGTDIWNRGLLCLPFPICAFVIQAPKEAASKSMLIMCEQIDDHEGRQIDVSLVHSDTPRMGVMVVHPTKKSAGPMTAIRGKPLPPNAYPVPAESGDLILRFLCAITGAMLSRDVSLSRCGPSDRRMACNAAQGRKTGTVYHKLVISPALQNQIAESDRLAGHGHASPRMHWRRGHFRHLSDDRIVPVAPCIVGSSDHGIVAKDYVIAQS